MNRNTGIALALVAVVLIPAALYIAINILPSTANPYLAFWAPLVALAFDALIFYAALGAWKLETWDRVGIAVVLPLLLVMASWAVMINTITAQMPPPQLIQGSQ